MSKPEFRAWNLDKKRMEYQDGKTPAWVGDILTQNGYVPLQYTNLKDKNGRKIYEGDIVITGNYPDLPAEIVLGKVEFMIDYLSQDGDLLTPAWIEVVGNVYENPELLNDV